MTSNPKKIGNESSQAGGSRRFFVLSSIGFVMIFVGIIILMIASLFYGKGTINFGEVIFIGPFPIVIGVGPNVKLMISIAIILAVLSVVMLLILRRQVIRVNA